MMKQFLKWHKNASDLNRYFVAMILYTIALLGLFGSTWMWVSMGDISIAIKFVFGSSVLVMSAAVFAGVVIIISEKEY